MTEPSGPRPLAESVERLLAAMEAPSVDVVATVFSRWSEIVGVALAGHCWPVSVTGENLVIEADDPVWASELGWLESELLARLAAEIGSDRFRSVTVRVQRHRSTPPPGRS